MYGAGIIFSSFASLVFWGQPVARLWESLKTRFTTVVPVGMQVSPFPFFLLLWSLISLLFPCLLLLLFVILIFLLSVVLSESLKTRCTTVVPVDMQVSLMSVFAEAFARPDYVIAA